MHDITLTTDGATTPGTSTYVMHIDNCTNYFITRCQILPGNASDGTDGLDGANGADGSIVILDLFWLEKRVKHLRQPLLVIML